MSADPAKWLVISTYSDGDRLLEAVWDSWEQADADIERVQSVRADQDEAPVVTVEKVTGRRPTPQC